ncbi:dimethylarginine dimethylaminohydrolase family protein [Porphyromonas sp. COT-239 OH1446]|uniref:dimethylarginine dimethylaminohydrolase family protein n=1 Tax=Porphyromonas sp. COT-239 OH1446 TaxID=1515613 RepID=UPI00052D01A2|nr:arginine deiminase family protein [Porphyromonas sp. COT-239 OH1446]KGN67191.1 cytochrome C biogenesis protein CcmF [Porphyromonas sp. COT-239 OH1446]
MTQPIIPSVSNETDYLKVVVLGLPESLGGIPSLSETYDAKSYEAVSKGFFPTEEAVKYEMGCLLSVLERNGVEVLRPAPLPDYNQVFARDVSFVVDDTIFVSNLIPDRELETGAFDPIISRIPSANIEYLPERVHTEGGDILLFNDILFVGSYLREDYPSFKTARTNRYAVDYLREHFPHKQVIALELRKHDQDPRQSVLHLDCAFQPVGRGKALIYREGFLVPEQLGLVEEIFGRDNLFAVTPEEAYHMNTNVVSLAPDRLISDQSFTRMNRYLTEEWGIAVETVPYQEISKMGGLLRCSTMPLVRTQTK